MKRDISGFGEKLEKLMIRKGVNPGELAEKIGILPSNICQLKRARNPRPKTVFNIAKALEVDVDVFFD